MIEKSEMKKSIYHSAGCDADDWLEASKRTCNGFEGAKMALKKSSQDLLGIAEAVKKDLDDGNLDGMEPSQVADYAIMQITRCRTSLENASQHYENRQIAAQGEVTAYEKVVDRFKKLFDREDAKIQGVLEAIASGEIQLEDDGGMVKQAGNGQVTGVRPTMSIAAQRKAEAAAESAQDGAEDEEEKAEAKEEAAKEKPKKTRKRRRKKKDEDVDAKDS